MIAREGMVPAAAAVLAAVLVLHFVGLPQSLVFWMIVLLVLMLFRDPEREIPSQPLAVVSPADGKITSISTVPDPYLPRQSVRVVIQMPPYGVFTTRSPIEGKVLETPSVQKDSNIPHGVWLQSDEGDDIVMVMTRGPLKNEPRCYIRIGERIGQGKRCGFVHLGGRVEVYLPENCRPVIAEGDTVHSGSDIIAKLVHA
ncbi:MAG: phosphatidylserine decarboxylase [Gammaproteobacteria bacterium]|jgi:phosphatidylserine decarboxylase